MSLQVVTVTGYCLIRRTLHKSAKSGMVGKQYNPQFSLHENRATLKSAVNEILWCDQTNETSLVVLF